MAVKLSIICSHTPVQSDVPLHVALMASWHLLPAFSNMQFRQHGLFLSLNRGGRRKNETVHQADIQSRCGQTVAQRPIMALEILIWAAKLISK